MSARLPVPDISFQPMSVRDVPEIGDMEQRNYDFPWSASIFRDCVKAGYHCVLMRLDGIIIGYGILQLAADEAHILNICIDQPYQRRGHARQLLDYLTRLTSHHNAAMVFLEVRPSNPRAITLYELSGFNEIGIRKGYYNSHAGREDAIVMAKALVSSQTQPDTAR